MVSKSLLYIFSLIRIVLISVNLLILGLLHLFLVIVLGFKAATKFSLPWIWGKIFCFICGAKVLVKGKNNIPKQGSGAIFLFSHSSYLDIPVLFASQRAIFNFAAKEFILKYPILGSIMKAVKSIIIYKDREKSIHQYKLAEERLKKGEWFMISPEGGRSSGETLSPFKSGPFIFAMNAHATLVPVVIYGTHKLWPGDHKIPNLNSFKGKVYVEYLEPISTKDFTDENRKQKAEEIRQKMLTVLETMKSR